MRRVLVLGAAGFIGTALCKRLRADGCDVYGVDIERPPRYCNFLTFDLRDRDAYSFLGKTDEVYQLAADVGGVAYLSGGHDADVMANNVAINRNVAQWAVGRCGVLVFTSSACVYPAGQLSGLWSEDCAFAGVPANDYGAEKLFSEHLYQAHARDHGLNVRIARLGNVYGPGEPTSGSRAHMVGDLCRKALGPTPGPLQVWGDGHQVRSMVYIDDVVDGLIALARSSVTEPVNIAGRPASVAEIADFIGDISCQRVEYVPGPTGARSSALDTTKAETLLGWRATTPLDVGLRRTYDWARAA